MPERINSIGDLVAAARGRRLSLGLSQAELARRARVSRQWISEFEGGKATAELGLVIRLLDALGLRLNLDDDAGPRRRDGERGTTVDLDDLLEQYHRR